MSTKELSRRGFLTKTGLVLSAAALGQVLPEGIVRLAGKQGLWLPRAYADAGLLGPSLPIITAVKTGNYLQFLILSELYANKGIVNAAENDRFTFEVVANFLHAQTGEVVVSLLPQEFGVEPSGDANLRMGSTIKVVPLTLTIPEEGANLVKTVLNGGSSVTYQATIALVLTDASGGKHYLASVVVTGAIAPAPILEPVIEPTAGPLGTQFTITDPQGRIQQGSLALFYTLGQDPADGANAENIEILDPNTLRGIVPQTLQRVEHLVAVRPSRTSASYFDDVLFMVL